MDSLGYMERPCLKKAKQKARMNLYGRVRTSDGEEGMQTRPLDPNPMSTLVSELTVSFGSRLYWWEQLMHIVSGHKIQAHIH